MIVRPSLYPLVAAVLLLAGGLAGPAAARPGLEAEAVVEPRVVDVDGTVRLTLRVAGPGLLQPRLRPRFELENLEIVGGPDQSHGLLPRLGGGRWSYSWTWYLRPRSAGSAAVTSIRLLVDEQELDLPPRRIEAVPGGPPGVRVPGSGGERGRPRGRLEQMLDRMRSELLRQAQTGDGRPEIFLRSVAEPPRPFVGQRTVFTTYLYTRVRVQTLHPETMPEFEGCWVREVDLPGGSQEDVEVDGVPYVRSPIIRRELYPLRSGRLELGSVAVRLGIERLARSRSLLRPVRVRDEVTRRSNPVTLAVRPLPPPPNLLGGSWADRRRDPPILVGPVRVETRMDPEEVPVGRSATLTVAVTGEGNLDALPPPLLPAPDGLYILAPEEDGGPPPAARSREPAGSLGPSGARVRVWRYTVLPERRGSWELPTLEVPWFDPETGEYRLATAPPGTLSTVSTTADEGALGGQGELHPVRSAALPAPLPRRWRSLLPWAFGVPWLLALALLVARRAGMPFPGTAPHRAVPGEGAPTTTELLQRFSDALDRAVAEERPRRAAGDIERAWRHLLCDGLGVPAEQPAAVWPGALERRGTPDDLRTSLAELLEDLHYLRYAPELSDTASLAGDLAARSRRLARRLLA